MTFFIHTSEGDNEGTKLTTMRRVLITGSRAYKDIDTVFQALEEQYDKYGAFVLVHGACKDGVDNFAVQWYNFLDDDKHYGIVIEPHAADWKPNGRNGPVDRGAGIKRNHLMVALGADVCLAFPTVCEGLKKNCPKESHYSHGTFDCMEAARKALIPVENLGERLDSDSDL